MAELVVFSNLKLFSNERFQIQYLEHEGKFYFKALDIARNLGYLHPRKAVRDHVKDKYKHNFNTSVGEMCIPNRLRENRGGRNCIWIPIPGLFQFLAQSKMPAAEPFQDWVFETVLPSIFETGRYELEDLEKFKEIADDVTPASENAKEIKKICVETHEKLKDKKKVTSGRNGGRACQQKIRDLKKNFKQQKIDLALFTIKDKLTTHAIEQIQKQQPI